MRRHCATEIMKVSSRYVIWVVRVSFFATIVSMRLFCRIFLAVLLYYSMISVNSLCLREMVGRKTVIVDGVGKNQIDRDRNSNVHQPSAMFAPITLVLESRNVLLDSISGRVESTPKGSTLRRSP